MIAQPVSKLLVAQVAHELAAHQTYAGMALYFDRQSLHRWAKVFRDQSIEEADHASKIMAFLLDNEVEFDLPGLPSATTHYAAPPTRSVSRSRARSRSRGSSTPWQPRRSGASDHRSLQFLQWFIDEQVEEERTMRACSTCWPAASTCSRPQELLDSVG